LGAGWLPEMALYWLPWWPWPHSLQAAAPPPCTGV